MPRRPGFKVMAIQFGEEVEDMKALESSLSITAGGSLQLSNGFRLNLVGSNSGIRLSDITLGRELGRGASSKVLEGTHNDTGQKLAVKMLTNVHDAELRKQLKAELAFMNEINHAACPFLNQIYDSYFADDSCYLVVEFCSNGPLDSALEKRGPMPEHTLSFTVRCIFLGLNYLFQCAVLHRDMKPANCLISDEGTVKISDFGSSKKLGGEDDGIDNAMLPGTFTGTLRYMSPERLQGERYSWPGDIWSAGLIMLECAYGKHPYTTLGDKAGFLEMSEYTRSSPTPPMPQAPYQYSEAADEFAQMCLQKDPCQRPAPIFLVNEQSVDDSHPFILQYKELGPEAVREWLGLES